MTPTPSVRCQLEYDFNSFLAEEQMRTHRILVEFTVEAKDKLTAEAEFKTTQWPNNTKVVDILYVKPCKKEVPNGIRKD
jgi:hypothetical protein